MSAPGPICYLCIPTGVSICLTWLIHYRVNIGVPCVVWANPRRPPMITVSPKNISILSCGFMLCLSLSDGTQADEYRKYDPCAEIPGKQSNPVKCGEKHEKGLHIISGEVLHLNSTNLLVKQSN